MNFLRQYQIDAVRKLQCGSILCGGVGSGKSRTALAYYYICNGGVLKKEPYQYMKNPKDLYIITTARKRDTLEWENELGPFLLSVHDDINYYSNKVVIDSWNNLHKYSDVKNSFFIFDEQRVVGKGQWVKSFLKIVRGNNEWILLSATPGDTWSDYIPVFLANGFYKTRSEFEREHVVKSYYGGYPKIEKYLNTGRLIRLRNKILVDMDFNRTTISHHDNIYVSYNKTSYKDICRKRWNPFLDAPIVNASEFCYALRRIVNSDATRQIAILEIMEKHPRVIIFYNFDYELEILKTLFNNFPSKIEVAEWNGHKHQPLPEGKCWAYLVQYTAGAEGWNCITTDTIIFYSQNYSYKIMTQASGRIDRLNTPYTDLYYYHLKSKSGIDLAIERALKQKKKFNEKKFASF